MKVSDIQVTPIHPERWGDDLDVVNAARVSFNKESEFCYDNHGEWLDPKDVRLINYLAKHKHFSPFNHAFMSFRVKAPIFVARQLVKHKFMPWNEVSRRYVDDEPEFYFPDYWRAKAENVKQGSSNEAVELVLQCGLATKGLPQTPFELCQETLDIYKGLLDQGVCAEQARMVLPQNTITEWIWSGTLGAFCDMLVLRLNPHTQKESRIVAEKIRDEIAKYFPVSLKARLEN